MSAQRSGLILACALALASTRAWATNQLSNGAFASSLSGWTAQPTGSAFHDPTAGLRGLGAARTIAAAGQTVQLSQCVAVVPGGIYDAHAYCRLSAAQDSATRCGIHVEWYAGNACDSGFIVRRWSSQVTPADGWKGVGLRLRAPAGAHSARLALWNSASSTPSSGSNAHHDLASFDRVLKGDLDNDDATDVVLRRVPPSNAHFVWFMNGTTRIGSEVALAPSQTDPFLVLGGVDEFTGDGRNDLVFQQTFSGGIEIWAMQGAQRLGDPLPVNVVPASNQWRVTATGHFNDDLTGSADLVLRNLTTQKLEVWIMDGPQRLSVKVPTPDQATDGNWRLVAAADFDQDAHTDFLWYNVSTGKVVIWLLDEALVRTSGQFTNPDSAGDASWVVVGAGDYGVGVGGSLGTADVLWRNSASGKFVVWHMDTAGNRTSGLFTTPDAPVNPLDWNVVGPR